MSRCFDHKTTFPDTHRHFRLAIEISRELPIVCRGQKLKKSNLENEKCLEVQLMNYIFERKKCFRKIYPDLLLKNKGHRTHDSELRLHLHCAFHSPCFLQMGYANTVSAFIFFVELHILIFIYILCVNT